MWNTPEVPTERVEVMKLMAEAQIYKALMFKVMEALNMAPGVNSSHTFKVIEQLRASFPISPTPSHDEIALAEHINRIFDEIQERNPPA